MNENVINETIILENFKNNVNLGDTKIVDCYNLSYGRRKSSS